MKKLYHILTVVLFVTGALLTSCNKVETTPEDNPEITSEAQTIQFTATLAAKGDDLGTKAITVNNQGTADETLTTAWKVGEQIRVEYNGWTKNHQQTIGTTATVTAVDPTTGTATISALLDNPVDGCAVYFYYPATIRTNFAVLPETTLLSQHGNLTARTTPNASVDDISTNFDYAKGSGTLSVAAGTAVVSKVTMTNEVCICKFRFTLDTGSGIGGGVQQSFNNIKIYDGNGHVYTITSDRPHEYMSGTRNFTDADDIYVAMLPVSSKTVIFHYEQSVVGGKANYIKFAPNTTLAAGKFYRSLNLTLTKDDYTGSYNDFKDLSAGSITAASGDYIYQSSSAATTNTITIPDGATVTIAGVNINATATAGITCSGTASINLVGTNSVTSTAEHYPAVQPGGSGTTLTISGSGSLAATGALYAAGIGSGYQTTCGSITISGGTVNATGGNGGAGIGSGKEGTCGLITINGGTITATGGNYAPGIGTGVDGHCGNINITTGVTSVTATKGNKADIYYSIGKGDGILASCGTVTIGGTVYYNGTNFVNGGETYLATSPFTWPTP